MAIVMLLFACYGGHFVIISAFTIKFFGFSKGPEIYSILFYSFGFAALFDIYIIDSVLPEYDYQNVIYFYVAASAASFVLTLKFEEHIV